MLNGNGNYDFIVFITKNIQSYIVYMALYICLHLICIFWENNREAGDLRRYCANYDVIVMVYHY